MSTSRTLSLIIALAYVTIGVQADGFSLGIRLAIFCVLPCACIWFPEAMGDYTDRNALVAANLAGAFIVGCAIPARGVPKQHPL